MKRDIFHTFYFQLARVVLAFITSVFAARLLGPEGKSDMAVFLLSVSILAQIVMFGVGPSVTHYVAKRMVPVRWFARLMIGQILFAFAVCTLIFVLIRSPEVLQFLVPQPQSLFFHIALPGTVAATILMTFSGAFLRAELNFRTVNLAAFSQAVVVLALTFAFFLVGPDRETAVRWSVLLFAVTTLAVSIYQFIVFRRSHPSPQDGTETARLRDVFGYSRKTFVADLAQMLAYRSDIWFVLYFLTPNHLGQYVLAVNLGQMLWILPNVIGSVLMPNISRNLYDAATVARGGRIAIALLAAVGSAVAVLGLWAVPILYGAQFAPAGLVLLLLMPGMIAIAATKIYANYLAGLGRVEVNQRASLVTLVAIIALDLVLIPTLGLPGAAIATSLAYVFTLAIVLTGVVAHTGIPVRDLLVPRLSDLKTFKGLAT